uniref:Rad21/Rec8-like protein C-terminal eukaryotic domain-containing protein n=1 Tax=Cyclopterus lumpus TaxID=8103 RepID=A0A8C2X6V3_CYCLU
LICGFPRCLGDSDSDAATFSLGALCEGGTRSQAATTFFCLLNLKKLKAIHLQQRAPYEDIIATPGANFYN